jgi:apolipoprotein D and lipocalin family protein
MKYLLLSISFLLASCTGMPDNIKPVEQFELQRYLGTWYEVARLDHSFERGLSHVTANYTLRDDGGVKVINRGYSQENKAWKEAEGKAYFVDRNDVGYLKVSFFGPFYGSYVVFELDKENYNYALISGPNKEYFWILARQPQLAPKIQQRLIEKAKSLGFATENLILVDHAGTPPLAQ